MDLREIYKTSIKFWLTCVINWRSKVHLKSLKLITSAIGFFDASGCQIEIVELLRGIKLRVFSNDFSIYFFFIGSS